MKQEKVIIGSFLLKLTKQDKENRRKLEQTRGGDFSDILRDLMAKAVDASPESDVVAGTEVEFRHFLDWVNKSEVLGTEKTFTPSAFKAWKARRKIYTARQIAEAFANLQNEPDRWQLQNNGFRPLSWWLEKDDRIEMMKNCHLKGQGKAPSIVSI